MSDVVIIDAVRTPIGRRNGGLATVHPTDLLATTLKALVERNGIDPLEVGQVVGGCVSQVGEQSFNVTRTAWLTAGLPQEVAATTVDTQCGSSQQATNLASALVAGGVVDVAIACGVEAMSRVPIGSNSNKALGLGVPIPKSYFPQYEFVSQFEGAERIADKWGITRADADAFGVESQRRAALAWNEGRFDTQVIEIDAPDVGDGGEALGTTHRVSRDEGLRETTLEKLSGLKAVARDNGVHTAGTASQISDGAAAVLIMSATKAAELGLTARARIVDTALVGVDPDEHLGQVLGEGPELVLPIGDRSMGQHEIGDVAPDRDRTDDRARLTALRAEQHAVHVLTSGVVDERLLVRRRHPGLDHAA